ncbi:MAG: GlsB/YeaQ/YmgE family stress response membrane protein [Ilumatobacteraceae bacterium]
MIGFILFLLIVGIIGGFVARAVVPGPDPMSFGGTLLLGVIGSFVGGFLGYLLFRNDANDGAFQASGIIGSIVGSIVALLVYRAASGRRHLHT